MMSSLFLEKSISLIFDPTVVSIIESHIADKPSSYIEFPVSISLYKQEFFLNPLLIIIAPYFSILQLLKSSSSNRLFDCKKYSTSINCILLLKSLSEIYNLYIYELLLIAFKNLQKPSALI